MKVASTRQNPDNDCFQSANTFSSSLQERKMMSYTYTAIRADKRHALFLSHGKF